ncbi:CHAP domain-containing protein [Methylobacter sp. YRD-M1]|uniref:CHAP domain-containing protein n=1 Tax=Methylobacter sp. YRD-M1 TaxID=2911520 RepID=UPI00227B1AB0|nr:CHAP domain-containing protein [Methylobacter sp. YRD-M1]WAK01845.1 CHAP domain-containing protein [Methylobacter sp. YRD-M1]
MESTLLNLPIPDRIIKIACQFEGLREVKSNTTWNNALLTEKLLRVMKPTGWKPPQPYCMAFVQGVLIEALSLTPKSHHHSLRPVDPLDVDTLWEVKTKLCPHVLTSYNNLKPQISKAPQVGSVFFMQKGKSASGHAGIVLEAHKDHIVTIEGNTSPAPGSAEKDRNGDGIYRKKRALKFDKTDGLHLLGFYSPF